MKRIGRRSKKANELRREWIVKNLSRKDFVLAYNALSSRKEFLEPTEEKPEAVATAKEPAEKPAPSMDRTKGLNEKQEKSIDYFLSLLGIDPKEATAIQRVQAWKNLIADFDHDDINNNNEKNIKARFDKYTDEEKENWLRRA
jgi:hypothetical protein